MDSGIEIFESLKLILLSSFLFGAFVFAFVVVGIYFLKTKQVLERENSLWKVFTALLVVFIFLSFPSVGFVGGMVYGVHKESKKYADTLIKPFLESLYPELLNYFGEKLRDYEGLSLQEVVQKIKNLNWIESPEFQKPEIQKTFSTSPVLRYFQTPLFNSTANEFLSSIFIIIVTYQAQEMGISKEKIYITKELIQGILAQKANPKLFDLIYKEILKFWDELFYITYLKLGIFLLIVSGILGLDYIIYKNRNSSFNT